MDEFRKFIPIFQACVDLQAILIVGHSELITLNSDFDN